MKPTARVAAAAAAVCLGLAACTAGPNGTAETPDPTTASPTLPTSTPNPRPSPSPQSPSARPTPVPTPDRSKSALEMTPEEAAYAFLTGEISLDEYCDRDTFFTSGDTQMCYFYKNPQTYVPPDYPEIPEDYGGVTWQDSPTRFRFATHAEAYAAWEQGMPYYEAFCLNYVPVTPGGVSQCEGIQAGTVDAYTGEYIGP